MNRSLTLTVLPLVVSAAFLVPNSADAVPVSVETYSASGFTVSSSDLLNGISPSAISGTGTQEGLTSDSSGAVLTNGVYGTPGLPGGATQTTIVNNGASITYTLLTATNITEIDTFSDWRDDGRSKQDYTVLTSVDGSIFTPLFTVHSGNAAGGPNGVKVATTDTGSGVLATGVKAIEFSFPSTQNGYVGYREIDVFDSASPVPESATWLAAGGFLMVGAGDLRRRFRAA